jgi:hypothetical protein
MDPKERVICIPDDSLPNETPGFPIYKQHGAASDKKLEEIVRSFKQKYAESDLHSKFSSILKKKVSHSHKYSVYCLSNVLMLS